MKLFLRGMMAIGVSAVFAFTVLADAPAPAPAAAAGCGCGESAGAGGHGRHHRIGGFFTRLAGPPVEADAGPAFGKNKGGPHTQPGTVVFPQHPFIRSPRDFFMMEQ